MKRSVRTSAMAQQHGQCPAPAHASVKQEAPVLSRAADTLGCLAGTVAG